MEREREGGRQGGRRRNRSRGGGGERGVQESREGEMEGRKTLGNGGDVRRKRGEEVKAKVINQRQ